MLVFDLMGNVHPEVLAEVLGTDLVIGSGEPLSESSDHGLDHGETFTFGNDGSD